MLAHAMRKANAKPAAAHGPDRAPLAPNARKLPALQRNPAVAELVQRQAAREQ